MSGLALGWARKRRDVPSREAKAWLMYLADNANEQMAWPSKGTLAEDMMCSEKTVMRLLAELVEAGLLVRLDVEDRATGRTRTCGYYFPVQGRPPCSREIAQFEREVGGRVTRVSPWEGDMDVPLEGDTGVPLRVTIVSPLNEPPLEPESSDELSQREGESALARDVPISDIEGAMPRRMVAVSDRAAYRAALEALAGEGVDLDVLPGCLRRWGEDPLFAGRKVPVALEKWLASGQWRASLAEDAPAIAPAEPACAAPPGEVATWVAVMAEMQATMGAGPFGSYLGRAALGQIGEALFVIAATSIARDWLRANRWDDLRSAWARRDVRRRELTLVSKSEFEARLRHGGE